jgi:mono/diheme cytochrome c family protein
VAPSLRDDRWRNGDGGLADILEVVRNGASGTAMPAYPAGISDEMARKVAAYVWAVSQGKAEP